MFLAPHLNLAFCFATQGPVDGMWPVGIWRGKDVSLLRCDGSDLIYSLQLIILWPLVVVVVVVVVAGHPG